MERFMSLREKFSLDSVKKNADTVSSAVRSRSSRIGSFSTDIAHRFQNDIYAWSTTPTIQDMRNGLNLPRLQSAKSSADIAELKKLNDCAPMVVYAESLNSKHRKFNEKNIHEMVDKFIKVILPETDDVYDKRHMKSFRHMRHYSFYRRTDRDLIRRRLASEATESLDEDSVAADDSPMTEASSSLLQAKLRTGPNLQICFMNEVASDAEDCEETCDVKVAGSNLGSANVSPSAGADDVVGGDEESETQPLSTDSLADQTNSVKQLVRADSSCPAATNFVEYQLQLREQTRQALASCERAAREQLQLMTAHKLSPTTRVVRAALQKIGVDCPLTRRRVNRSLLSDMNVAQLQIVANDLHACIEELNGVLMSSLVERDEAVMERDSQLVHIEDLISYYGQKERQRQPPSAVSVQTPAPSSSKTFLQRFSSKSR